ncbi:unnamed protein product [Darwinula stevensoni]|uniref:Uncharacterized protein n=1 Tax=Darwinula stevensoni TaxID=69355 RepID=A0A7R8X3I4_9CRUS|nr:unnamed protein product [Darwinula stevensoni]CAG0878685.1 unnamed protein product [Darwinula stevensoni]
MASGGSRKFDALKDVHRSQMIHLLETDMEGQKDIIFDRDLMKVLDIFLGASILRSHGVGKIFTLDKIPPKSDSHRIVYCIASDLKKLKIVCNHMLSQALCDKEIHILFVPRFLHVLQVLMEEEGLWDKAKCHEFELGFLPLDDNVLSLESIGFFTNVFLNKDWTQLRDVAYAVHQLQSIFGKIPDIFTVGEKASKIKHMLDMFEAEIGLSTSAEAEIEAMYLFDRDIDLPAILLSQMSYSGLLDEEFTFKTGTLEFTNEEGKTHKLMLSAADEVFQEMRDQNFRTVLDLMKQRTKTLKETMPKLSGMGVKDMKALLSGPLQSYENKKQAVNLHLTVTETLVKCRPNMYLVLNAESDILRGESVKETVTFLQDHICSQRGMVDSVRLAFLYAICQGGVATDEFLCLKKDLIAAYGAHLLPVFLTLKRLMIELKSKSRFPIPLAQLRSSFAQSLTRKLQLLPIIFQDAEETRSLKFLEELLPASAFIQRPNDNRMHRFVLLVFIGGVTFAEMAAFRKLGLLKGVSKLDNEDTEEL